MVTAIPVLTDIDLSYIKGLRHLTAKLEQIADRQTDKIVLVLLL